MKNLSPAYFGLVMATGIVSIAALDFHLPALAVSLFVLNVVAYVALIALNVLRAVRYWPEFAADVTDHGRGPGFFTIVAATCIIGAQLRLIANDVPAATAFLAIGLVLWLIVTYTIFTAFTI